MFSTYSLLDIKLVFNHPDVGKMVLSGTSNGGGRITCSFSGDMSSHTTTATGYTVVNKLRSESGSIGLEVPTNSPADKFLKKWVKYLKTCTTDRFALATLQLDDPAGGERTNFKGVTPQKDPDKGYDATSGNRQYNLLFAESTTSAM